MQEGLDLMLGMRLGACALLIVGCGLNNLQVPKL